MRTRNIFEPGFLSHLTDEVLSGRPANDIKRLTNSEMSRLPEIYANVDYDSIGCDDEKGRYITILDVIDVNKMYKTGNNKEILGADIKAITTLMYLKPRTAYWKPDKPQVYDTSVCGAVPIPMLGFKRWKRLPYSYWWNQFYYLHDGHLPVDLHGYDTIDFDVDITDINMLLPIDLLLGKTLASTEYNEETDQFELTKNWGLAILSLFQEEEWRPTYKDTQYFRDHNIGNYRGSYATAYGTVAIEETWNDDIDWHDMRVRLHNRCSTPMRLLLSQRWAWYGRHRNSDMICDFQNWDNLPKNVDNLSVQMCSQDPEYTSKAKVKARFGLL